MSDTLQLNYLQVVPEKDPVLKLLETMEEAIKLLKNRWPNTPLPGPSPLPAHPNNICPCCRRYSGSYGANSPRYYDEYAGGGVPMTGGSY